jgi:hypothetical protein
MPAGRNLCYGIKANGRGVGGHRFAQMRDGL